MEETVLAYIFNDDEVLMLFRNKKKNDINKGKWMGVGGHIEKGETPEQALIREIKEETNLDVISYKFRGTLLFINNEYQEKIYLYTVDKYLGNIKECNEGDLQFFNKEDVVNLNMWKGDYYFYNLLLKDEPYFELTLIYDKDELIRIDRNL